MKILIFTVIFAFLAVAIAIPPPPTQQPIRKSHLLGEKECTYGPSFWCQNLTNAADCHATKHCIQTVWIHKEYPEDKTSICDTCKDMVKQARDQLESNETQELIKEVFEGSCALLHLKPIVKECDKIADDYIPELIDTLASEMDPQTVCAVAGLCNSVRIQQILLENEEMSKKQSTRNTCDDCNSVMDLVVEKFTNMNRDEFMEWTLQICGRFGSFSDSCSNIVMTNFEELYQFLKQNLNAGDFCLLSGECSANFHKHDIEITPMSKIGYVPVKGETDDLPCELCEQLVIHLREILVANTTEAEFKQVLEGICKQAKTSFSAECLSIVDNYYDIIYDYVTKGLNATFLCDLIKICPDGSKMTGYIAPLLPVESVSKLGQKFQRISVPNQQIDIKIIKPQPELSAQEMQLPIDLLVPPHQQVYNPEVCTFCEYFLHYLQQAITDPKFEKEVKQVVDNACSKLPKSVNETCVEFVNTYEEALVAILAQEIDPSQVCPMIKACPTNPSEVDIFMNAKSSSGCPLCLYAITELESLVKGDKSKERIKAYLDEICDHLSKNLQPECTDFVSTYTDEIVEMIVADFKPQEVCVYLKQCTDNTPSSELEVIDEKEFFVGDPETNIIYDNTFEGHAVDSLDDEKCILCEFVMKEVDDELKKKSTDDDIKNVVHTICSEMPGTIKTKCNDFVDQYGDAIIILLQEALDPKEICSRMKFCSKLKDPLQFIREEAIKCGVCTSTAQVLHSILKNPKIDNRSADHILKKACRGLMPDMKKTCETITQEKGQELLHLISRESAAADSVCRSLAYCNSSGQVAIN